MLQLALFQQQPALFQQQPTIYLLLRTIHLPNLAFYRLCEYSFAAKRLLYARYLVLLQASIALFSQLLLLVFLRPRLDCQRLLNDLVVMQRLLCEFVLLVLNQ
jgi:hypothetical protein